MVDGKYICLIAQQSSLYVILVKIPKATHLHSRYIVDRVFLILCAYAPYIQNAF
jgi:hypothetical protein